MMAGGEGFNRNKNVKRCTQWGFPVRTFRCDGPGFPPLRSPIHTVR